jgi:23S rRNA (pseudouridine1915-N3)-methyltransferase
MYLIVTGKLGEAHWRAAEEDYLKRLKDWWKLEIKELPASKNAHNEQSKMEESKHQLAAIDALPKGTVVIVLSEDGRWEVDSVYLAECLQGWREEGKEVALMIGGAAGFTPEVKARADKVWSLSGLTLPHQMVRVLLAEQVYRAMSIVGRHPYHRG